MKKYCMFYITLIDNLDGLEKYLEYIQVHCEFVGFVILSDRRVVCRMTDPVKSWRLSCIVQTDVNRLMMTHLH